MRKKIFALGMCILLLGGGLRVQAAEKYVALTFDDGPSGRFTRRLLKGLQERDAKATFLLCGYRILEYPGETAQILEDGHEVGVHGYSHAPMNLMSPQKLKREIRDTLSLLPEGTKVVFLRPPGGQTNSNIFNTAEQAELAVLHWSVDPRDWATCDAAAVERAVLQQVGDGDVILLHDMSDSSVDAALDIVDILSERGFRFVTASELAGLKGVQLQPGQVYKRFQDGK